jgi:phage-related protein
VTRQLFKILNDEKFEPVDLLDLRLLGGDTASTIRLTNGGEQVNQDGNIYYPINFSRGGVEEIVASDTGNNPSVTVAIQNIDLQMAALLNRAEIEGGRAYLRMSDRRRLGRARDAMVICDGEIRDVVLTENTLVFEIQNVIGIMDRLFIPRRLYQSTCSYAYGSQACGATVASVTTTADTGTTQHFVIPAAGALTSAGSDPTDYYTNGYVVCGNGAAALQARPIQRIENGRIYLRYPFLVAPNAGDTVYLRRGCRKTKGDCADRQGNADQFGGFEEVPYAKIRPTYVKKYDLTL